MKVRSSSLKNLHMREKILMSDSEVLLSEETDTHQVPFPLEVQLDEDIVPTNNDASIFYCDFKEQSAGDIDSDDDGGIACDLCGRRFPNITGLKTHKRSHKDDGINPGQALFKPPPLVIQKSSQADEDEIECEVTGFPCVICKRSFPNICGLRTHERFFGHHSTLPKATNSAIKRKKKLVSAVPRSFAKVDETRQDSEQILQIASTKHATKYRAIAPANMPLMRLPVAHCSSPPHDTYLQTENDTWKMSNVEPDPLDMNTETTLGDNDVFIVDSKGAPIDEPDPDIICNGTQNQPSIPSSVKLKKPQQGSEYRLFSRHGMFYVCNLCGNRNLHINGFRSHWNRHVREGNLGSTLKP